MKMACTGSCFLADAADSGEIELSPMHMTYGAVYEGGGGHTHERGVSASKGRAVEARQGMEQERA